MSINTTYLTHLSRKDRTVKKLFFKVKKLFSKKSSIIQIGIGGYSSSGKTVLIDALFSLFDKSTVPGYMPHNFTGVLLDAPDKLAAYSGYDNLRAYVSSKFHTDHATKDEGIWNENTHCARLYFGKKETTLLIRNLPGEMFSAYFEQSGNENKSLKAKFKDFIAENKEHKKVFKKLFKFQVGEEEENQKAYIENKLKEMRDDFFRAIGLNDYPEKDAIPPIERNFFAFLFYLSSEYNIYCIKSKGLDEDEIEIANGNILRSNENEKDISKFMICFTQFDRIFNEKQLPNIDPISTNEETSGVKKFKNKFKKATFDLVGLNGNKKKEQNRVNNKLINYWLAMNKIYEDIQNESQSIVNESDWQELKTVVGNTRYNWFITSVAYNFSKGRFFDFQNQENTSTESIWSLRNNNERTPIGVLELMLYILTKSGFKKRNWGLALPKTIEFNKVTKKINGSK